MEKIEKKDIFVLSLCALVSIASGIISNDILVGGIILFTALANSYYGGKGNRITYIFGTVNCLLYSYVGFKNGLFGAFSFYLLIFLPMQFIGFINWGKNKNNNNDVIVRDFTLKNSIIVVSSCVVGSFLLAFLLDLIPNQQLAILDSASNILNICANILMILRFKECWWIWIFNNIIDLSIWTVLLINGGVSSMMMFLVSLGYLLLNIYGIAKWEIEARKNRKTIELNKR